VFSRLSFEEYSFLLFESVLNNITISG